MSSAGLAAHPFRYALIATLGVGCGMAILAAIGALGTVLVYIGLAFFLAIAAEPLLSYAQQRRMPRWAAVLTLTVMYCHYDAISRGSCETGDHHAQSDQAVNGDGAQPCRRDDQAHDADERHRYA